MATREEEDEKKEAKKIAKARRLHEEVRQLRGRLLNSLAAIDVAVSRLLAAYFCHNDDRRDLAFSDIFVSRLRLEYKARLLEKIIKKEFGWYLKGHTPNVFKDLHEIREFRNTLAHATVDVSDEALAKDPAQEVGFVYYKDGERKVKQVTAKVADNAQMKANMVYGTRRRGGPTPRREDGWQPGWASRSACRFLLLLERLYTPILEAPGSVERRRFVNEE